MSMNETPSAERTHIGFFGRRNAGKSSLVNAVTGQSLSVVSDVRGTTTDPVRKAMELLPLGPVVIIDTPGFDDDDEMLGTQRVQRTREVLAQTDIAVLVIDTPIVSNSCESELLSLFKQMSIPYLIAYNKADLHDAQTTNQADASTSDQKRTSFHDDKEQAPVLFVSAKTGAGIRELKETLAHMLQTNDTQKPLVHDLVPPESTVLLVVPIDSAAPKGRLILPQQQVLRDLLDGGCTAVVTRETELCGTLKRLDNRVDLVVTDSQVFSYVSSVLPPDMPLTSFSILMARYKGFLDRALEGIAAVDKLKDGDRVLIAEGCTHHRQCDDIGSVKIPRWLHAHTQKNLQIDIVPGKEFPADLSPYALIIHCGGCMLTERMVRARINSATAQGVPVTNYGTLIAYMNGILSRAIQPLQKTI